MTDELVTALLQDHGLRLVLVSAGALSRKARDVREAAAASASLLGEAFAGALLLGSLQKEKTRVNVQLECTGPLRGLFADAGSDGTVRGYVKNPHLAMTGGNNAFRWRPALGNSGYLSVLRERDGGDFYRSSVELTAFDFPKDLEAYFSISEQIDTRVAIDVFGTAEEPLADVVGVLVQTLPDGDRDALRSLGDRVSAGLEAAVREEPRSASALLTALCGSDFGELELMSRLPVELKCTCSRERVYRALVAMGQEELRDVLVKDKQAEATCEFCTTHYVVTSEEIETLLQRMAAGN